MIRTRTGSTLGTTKKVAYVNNAICRQYGVTTNTIENYRFGFECLNKKPTLKILYS